MQSDSVAHLSDSVLLQKVCDLITQDRLTTATLLPYLAEVDKRELYVRAGYSSMFKFCVQKLRMSEDAACRRIRAARASRKFPALLAAISEGRLHLAAVSVLAPHLTSENVDELIEGATHRGKSEVEELVARFSTQALPVGSRCVPARTFELAVSVPGRTLSTDSSASSAQCVTTDHIGPELEIGAIQEDPQQQDKRHAPPAPDSPLCFRFHVTISKSTREKLRYVQALLSHSIPSGDEAQIIDCALDALITRLERHKLGSTTRQARQQVAGSTRIARGSRHSRYIPAPVRRAVWKRDQAQCTFIGPEGTRCGERHFLEFDHVDPVARGGQATVDGMRLRCRAHNQYEAVRVFGGDFMRQKKQEARDRARIMRRKRAEASPNSVATRSG